MEWMHEVEMDWERQESKNSEKQRVNMEMRKESVQDGEEKKRWQEYSK